MRATLYAAPATPHHGAVEGAGGAGQHRGASQETSREGRHAMQDRTPKTPETTTAPPIGHSSVDKLPAELREAVNAAVADGATIDEIAALIKGEGGDCSRSAVGRYAKKYRAMLHERHELDRMMTLWMKEFGDRPQGQAGLVLIETMRTMVLGTMAAFAERGEPVPTQELARLSLVLKRIEDTDRVRLARERAAEKDRPPREKGLSPETVAMIDEAVLGEARWPVRTATSAPVDPWNPDESHPIPPEPSERWPEIAPRVFRTSPTSILSLGPE